LAAKRTSTAANCSLDQVDVEVCIAAHNGAVFDFPVIVCSLLRHGIGMSAFDFSDQTLMIRVAGLSDTLRVFRGWFTGVNNFKLNTVHQHVVGCDIENAHDALGDVNAMQAILQHASTTSSSLLDAVLDAGEDVAVVWQRTVSAKLQKEAKDAQAGGDGGDGKCDDFNTELCQVFEGIAEIHEALGDESRHRCYRKAVRGMKRFGRAITSGEEARGIVGVGWGIAAQIDEFLASKALSGTGEVMRMVELRAKLARAALDRTKVDGVGPKLAQELMQEHGICSVAELQKHAKEQGTGTGAGTGGAEAGGAGTEAGEKKEEEMRMCKSCNLQPKKLGYYGFCSQTCREKKAGRSKDKKQVDKAVEPGKKEQEEEQKKEEDEDEDEDPSPAAPSSVPRFGDPSPAAHWLSGKSPKGSTGPELEAMLEKELKSNFKLDDEAPMEGPAKKEPLN
jgi:hypothetical protein